MKKPTISILIPLYNKGDYVTQCLDSICNQTYKFLDIVIIDDCSTDKSYEIATVFQKKDKRIRLYRHDNNMGVSTTRNDLIHNVKGDYFMFVDADDTISANACELLIDNIIKNNVDILHFKVYWEEMNHKDTLNFCLKSSKYWLKLYNGVKIRRNDIFAIPNIPYGKVFKSYLKAYCYFEGEISEDFYFAYKPISFAKRIGFLDATLYRYEKGDSQSLTHTKNNFKNVFFVIICWCERIKFYQEIDNPYIAAVCVSHAYSSLCNLYKYDYERTSKMINDRLNPLIHHRYRFLFAHPFLSLRNIFLLLKLDVNGKDSWKSFKKH